MSTLPVNLRALKYCAALTLAVGIAAPAVAQPIGTYRSDIHLTVLPGRAAEWQAAVKDRNALWAKAGLTRRWNVWQSATGPTEYRIVAFYDKLAELDMLASQDPKTKDVRGELASVNARLQNCSTINSRVILQVEKDLSLPLAPVPPAMIVVSRTVIRADKADDYLAMLKNEFWPAVKTSGVTTFGVARPRFGGPTSEFYTSASLSNWADLDDHSSIRKAMGEAKYQAFAAKASAMTMSRTLNVYRYMADLSYVPAALTAAR